MSLRKVCTQSRTRWLAPALVLLLLVSALPLPGAEAATTMVMDATLPSPRDGTSAVSAGDHVYIFGGEGSTRSDQILRYDGDTDTLAVMAAKLPGPRSGTSAAWNGTHAFVFGGWGSPYSDDIVRYDPVTDSVDVMGASLPSGRVYTSAAFANGMIYVFGGGTTTTNTTDQIVRYDPATDTTTVMAAKLPSGRYGTSAVWDGAHIYVFGGYDSKTAKPLDQILRYDPVADSATVLAQTLPTARYHTSALLGDGQIHIIGGYSCSPGNPCAQILTFDPTDLTIVQNATTLTTGRHLTSAGIDGRHAYVFGGNDGARSAQILGFRDVIPNHLPVFDPLADPIVPATVRLLLDVTAHDADGDTITLAATPVPNGATFTDHGDGTGTLDWTPTYAQQGLHDLNLSASDGDGTRTLRLQINVTDAPDHPPVIDPIADLLHHAQDPLTVPVQATDGNGDTITLGATPLPTNATFTDHGDGTGTFAWTPARDQTGNHTITVTASANGTTTNETFTLDVRLHPNRAPVIVPVADRQIFSGDTLTLGLAASDPDEDTLTLALAPHPPGLSFTDHGDGTATLQWTVDDTHIGDHVFELSADDGALSTTESFLIDVAAGPPPVIDQIPNRTVAETTIFDQFVRATDAEGRPIVLSLSMSPPAPGLNFTDEGSGTGRIHWNTTYEDAGDYLLTVHADNGEASSSETFLLSVTNVDRTPVFTGAPYAVAVGLGQNVTQTINATDPDGDPITLSASGLPAGAVFTDLGGGSGRIQWADPGPVGRYEPLVTATAGDGSRSVRVTIDVVPLYRFQLSPITQTFLDVSPGATTDLTINVTNIGLRDDTITFTAFNAAPGQGFVLTAPQSVFVPMGETVQVNATVTATNGVYARPRVVATSTGDPAFTRALNWVVQVPLRFEVILDDPQPSITGGSALLDIAGRVNTTWVDGTPARNITFQWSHLILDQEVASGEASSGPTGSWRFDATIDPTFGLPGPHTLLLEANRIPRVDRGSGQWTVGP